MTGIFAEGVLMTDSLEPTVSMSFLVPAHAASGKALSH
jgi:hypothetical protein